MASIHRRQRRALALLQRTSPVADYLEDAFVDGMISVFDREREAIQRETAEAELAIAKAKTVVEECRTAIVKSSSIMQRMGEHQLTIKRHEGMLENLTVRGQNVYVPEEHQLRAQYRLIMRIPRVLSVGVAGERMGLSTDVLFGRDLKKRWRRIGPFNISFDIKYSHLSSFCWVNLDGEREQFHGPPNISEQPGQSGFGVVQCAGEVAQSLIQRATRQRDYPSLVGFSVRYPECAGKGTNALIEWWPIAKPRDVPEWYRLQFKE